MVHQHLDADPARPGLYDYCECGATRRRPSPGKPAEPWHACALCSTEPNTNHPGDAARPRRA